MNNGIYPLRPHAGICEVCWQNSTELSQYDDVCDVCLPDTYTEDQIREFLKFIDSKEDQ